MNRSQWITAAAAAILVFVLYFFGKTVPSKKTIASAKRENSPGLSIDSILAHYKKELRSDQIIRLNQLEQSVIRGDVHNQQLNVYHQLAHFWGDTGRRFEPYAWYEAEAARLENSEKSLTFAAHLFLENLRNEGNPALKSWKANQAKDLFERSLKLNPDNDSARIGLGATLLYGGLGETPMEGIQQIMKVVARDSQNVYALMTLGHASLFSGQFQKAAERFEAVHRIRPADPDPILLTAESYEQLGEKTKAVEWYEKSLGLVNVPALREEIQNRIKQLKEK